MTTPPMDADRLDAIRARCEKATAGPWGVTVYGSGQANVDMPRGRSFHFGTVYGAAGIATGGAGKPIHGVSGSDLDGLTEAEYDRQRYADADFIAEARTDVPDLLAEVDALRAMLKEARSKYDEAASVAGGYYNDDQVGCLCFDECYCRAGRAAAIQSEHDDILAKIDHALSAGKAGAGGEVGG